MRKTLKFNLWVNYFTDEKNKNTFGNATQSAIKAYGHDPNTQYNLASVTGSKNLIKYKVLSPIFEIISDFAKHNSKTVTPRGVLAKALLTFAFGKRWRRA